MEFWTALSAIATLLAVIVAIFKESIIAFLYQIKLEIVDYNLNGETSSFVYPDAPHVVATRGYKYYLKIINKSNKHHIDNCSIKLIKIERHDKGKNEFNELPMSVHRFFQFEPEELFQDKIATEFSTEQVFGLGTITQFHQEFLPALISIAPEVKIGVKQNETVKYHLTINAKLFRSKKVYIYEVSWDGVYIHPENPELMKEHLQIKRVKK